MVRRYLQGIRLLHALSVVGMLSLVFAGSALAQDAAPMKGTAEALVSEVAAAPAEVVAAPAEVVSAPAVVTP